MGISKLTPEETAALDPGIRLTVEWLRVHGFETTDSGDGVSKAALIDSGEAMPIPHVFMKVDLASAIAEADRLAALVRSLEAEDPEPGDIGFSYDPVDGSALLFLFGFDDEALFDDNVHTRGADETTPSTLN